MINGNKVNFDEFKQIIWNDISENIVSDKYLVDNKEFINELTFEMYDFYYRGDFSTRDLSKIIEKFFFLLFRFKADNENKKYKDRYYDL